MALGRLNFIGTTKFSPLAALLISAILLAGCVETEYRAEVESQPVTPVVLRPADPADEFAAIKKKFDEDVAQLKSKIAAAKTKAEKQKLFTTENPVDSYVTRLVEFAANNSANEFGFKAAMAAVEKSGRGKHRNAAMNTLLDHYTDQLETEKILASFLEEFPSPQHEVWIRKIIDNTEGKAKVSALLKMDLYLGRLPYFARTLKENPAIEERMPKEQVDYLYNPRTKEQLAKQTEDLQYVIDNGEKFRYRGRKTFADVAKLELYDLNNLTVGSVAPEITGTDFDKVDFKLSDYRGKVVMLDFWGQWCPPCRAMYPHDQHIVNKLAGAPFALIGVNSDRDFDMARDVIHDKNLSWRHFWDGPKGTAGPIDTGWNVDGWPTIYLIDAEGVIRYRGVLGDDLDRGLEELMAEMGHEVDLSRDVKTPKVVPTKGKP